VKKILTLIVALAGCTAARAADKGGPVVIELFTSQGCSSCPAADELLPELAAQPGVIALAFHVDYWDGLGWKDAFSSPRWTARQAGYGAVLRSGSYTPQLVVGGRAHVVGSDRGRARAAIAAAAREPALPVTVSATRARGAVQVSYDVGKERSDRIVQVALTEDGLVTEIARGENRGRTLRADHVVRALEPAPVGGTVTIPVEAGWGPLRAVVLVQDRATLALRGAAVAEVR
jgi:hypothetical protein